MKWIRIRHWIFGHPDLIDVKEEYGVITEMIAGTGKIGMSGWCTSCKQRIAWEVDYP